MRNNFFLFKLMNISTQKCKRFSSLFSMSFMLIILALTTWQCREDDFTGEVIGVCPEVITTDPTNGAINVVTNKLITATFNDAMNPSTINETTFILKKNGRLVSGAVSYSGVTATFAPTDLLEAQAVYSATITRGAHDPMGNMMRKDTTWSFNTGSAPEVVLTNPTEGASDVALNVLIAANFSTAMNTATINTNTFRVKQGLVAIAGEVSYSGVKATFRPLANLVANKVYTVTVSKDVKDLLGNVMVKDTTWSFATGTLPIIVLTDPLNGAANVPLNKKITATFSKLMLGTTFGPVTFTLKRGTNPVVGSVSYNDMTATFSPDNILLPGVEYTATIRTGVTDLSGKSIPADSTWKFTTLSITQQFTVALTANPIDGGSTSEGGLFNSGASVTVSATSNPGFSFNNWTESGVQVSINANYTFVINGNRNLVANFDVVQAGPLGVNLGSAGNFAVLAGSGVSNTGVSTYIIGDVGAFPTSTMNGLLSGNVNGILYTVASPLVGQAKTDLTTAYNDAQGRSLNAISLPGQLGGLTLAPGLYVNSSTSGISGTGTNGILTLDAGGNPNAVWIFKMGSTLITDAGTSIVLAGGAKAKNIYWSVGTSATLGTNSIFFGNILADQSITLTTGASLTGRALTRIGAVTLDTNAVTKPQ